MDFESDQLDRLIADWRNGNAAAYHKLLREASDRLRAFLRRRLGTTNDVEDLVQDCLIAMHEKRHTIDPNRPLAPWMFAIARYKLVDYWRRQKRGLPVTDQVSECTVPADDLAKRDVAVLLKHLSQDQAEAIRLTKIEGLTGLEASHKAGIGLSTLKVRVHRGIARLRKIVGERE